MKVLNFGSLNIDHVYRVADFVRPGETISAIGYAKFAGGKGLNQSIALARAGMTVLHAGRIGTDGIFLKELLAENQVDCSQLVISENEHSGHAVIQVTDAGENSIVLFGGANQNISDAQIQSAMSVMDPGDFLLLQNEISAMPEILRAAAKRGLRIFFNPAPMNRKVFSYPLELVDTFIVNETEGEALGSLPGKNILMTLGAQGARYSPAHGGKGVAIPAAPVDKVVDTTAAGDTFIGYFSRGDGPQRDAGAGHAGCGARLCHLYCTFRCRGVHSENRGAFKGIKSKIPLIFFKYEWCWSLTGFSFRTGFTA